MLQQLFNTAANNNSSKPAAAPGGAPSPPDRTAELEAEVAQLRSQVGSLQEALHRAAQEKDALQQALRAETAARKQAQQQTVELLQGGGQARGPPQGWAGMGGQPPQPGSGWPQGAPPEGGPPLPTWGR